MQSGGDMRPVHNSVDTVNAAAAAIVTAESRTQAPPEPRRKWADRLSVYFCFGSQKNGRRINHAALVPEPTSQRTDTPAVEIPDHPPPPVFPFVAPPSSPASFLQSEPTSIVQSPRIGAPPFSPLSPNSPSPTGPPSIFAIGPYAHETQLVSPPVFSAFTTEPSTAPFTPPPESVHLTTPSSPEVPYAKLLTSINNSKNGETGDLQSYPNYPDSPIARLISPSSGCSGTSSPFPDPEMLASSHYTFPSFPVREPPKILDGEGVATQKLIPRHMRNGGSILDGHIAAAVPVADFSARLQPNDHAMDHRVSFELTVEDVARCLEKKTAISGDSATASFHLAPTSSGDHKRESNDTRAGLYVDETYHDLPEKARRSLSLRLAKEFNFNNVDAANVEPSVGSDWWANEKVAGITSEPEKGWSFHPVAQPGVS
ncbi:hypothetical protein SEVIR_1G377700v4 [Setaria viridis]|uniref:Uncharacterized protein n=1 Tax=Setaria viridis TaxID=4556 RepID=A0A4U6WJC4_SETVI|nr:leucine-rich repeat extensin-like protein 5 [Setaria viridis]XP_034577945.1 leucine-rich repeat extensin-like protein 5 [Setaria viridis]TKW42333.1 hypothetical protein SEVIR_1G377700v2 [Setaria viridis]TKW42334.1 hypothetical protein SEVIR_1G377700v2 [Setaria viridis]